MNKKTILIVLAIIIGVIGFLILTDPKESSSAAPSEHKVGAGTSGVTLIEYGDFQCPACAQYYPVLQQVKEHYGDKITFQFRHFPLESIHPNARAAARAAEAASKQNKFWEMHDKLFESQTQWQDTKDPISVFEGYAESLGLDKAKFTEDYKSSTVSETITADLSAGRTAGAQSTPTFILNGQKLDPNPAGSLESFIELIDAKIAEISGQSSSGENENNNQNPESKPEESSDSNTNQ